MALKDYIVQAQATKPENKDKFIISNDAFAIVQAIEELTKAVRNI